jgi:hypothetical protein
MPQDIRATINYSEDYTLSELDQILGDQAKLMVEKEGDAERKERVSKFIYKAIQ